MLAELYGAPDCAIEDLRYLALDSDLSCTGWTTCADGETVRIDIVGASHELLDLLDDALDDDDAVASYSAQPRTITGLLADTPEADIAAHGDCERLLAADGSLVLISPRPTPEQLRALVRSGVGF